MMNHPQVWNYDINGSENVFHNSIQQPSLMMPTYNFLCGLVAANPEVLGSIPGTTKFSV
jgi:hypothetical protein